MYQSFYGLREKPFSLLPDPAFLLLGKQHGVALATLQCGLMNQAGCTVITGEIGCGKTTLIRHLLNELEQDVTVGLITNTHRSHGSLLEHILLAFRADYRHKSNAELYETFVNFLIAEYARNRRTVLIIDEAQNMDVETLEELRTLSNVNADKDQMLQLILVGQPQLRAMLARPELDQFAQRIAYDYHLGPLDPGGTGDYIRHRLTVAGGNPALFEPRACESVHHYSQGIPRLINVVCDTALVYGYGQRQATITSLIVRQVALDKARGGLFRITDKESGSPGSIGIGEQPNDRARPEPRHSPGADLSPEERREIARALFAGTREK